MQECAFLYLSMHSKTIMANKELNRLKDVLAEKRKRAKGLAYNWERTKQPYQRCTNTCQPDLCNLMKIAKLLEVEVADLLREENID